MNGDTNAILLLYMNDDDDKLDLNDTCCAMLIVFIDLNSFAAVFNFYQMLLIQGNAKQVRTLIDNIK